jgi:NAD(P)-dependent dehydrogenase (short-subunit alcohol dehydrogenase family)
MNEILSVIPPLLQGRLAFVTGAGQGIGRAIAIGLAQAGARVIATDLNERTASETAGLIALRGEVYPFPLDVTCPASCAALAERIVREIGNVDLLVNNAGIIIRENSDSPNATSNWKRTLDVNLNGTFNVTQAFLSSLRATRGTVVNLASIGSFVGLKGSLGYSPSKGAIKQYTQALAGELGEFGIRVNAIAPGLIATPLNVEARRNPKYLKSYLPRIPLGRIGHPEDLVGSVIFLSSSLAQYVTGVTLVVDGGFLAV